jgi:hypothetical protein
VPETGSPSHTIQVDDTVAYSDAFLNRQNRYPSDMPSAQGKVKILHRLDNGIILADIEWNKPGLPKRVNVKNLTKSEAAAFGK